MDQAFFPYQNYGAILQFLSSGDYLMLSILVGFSIYYIYNYYLYFVRVFEYKFLYLVGWGAVVSIGVFVMPGLWAVLLGAEVVLVGIAMIAVSKSKKTRESEGGFFMKKFVVFSIIGGIIIALGFYFYIYVYGRGTGFSALFFLLYLFYILLCIGSHINKNYLLSLLGKFNTPQKSILTNKLCQIFISFVLSRVVLIKIFC